MNKIGFISDFYRHQLLGGGESNDDNLIQFLKPKSSLFTYKSGEVTVSDLQDKDFVIVSNFVLLSEEVKSYLASEKKYIIYEHDHKYVKTRDPSKYVNFLAPKSDIINRDFYTRASKVVVLSKICKEVLQRNIPECDVTV